MILPATVIGPCRLSPVTFTASTSPSLWLSVSRRFPVSTFHTFTVSSLDALTKTLRVSQAELGAALGIPERTLARRKKEGTLSSDESARLVRLARVVERAEAVFEDLDAALNWLKSPNAALAGVIPLSLMDTDIGADSVLDTLGRIEHGVFA